MPLYLPGGQVPNTPDFFKGGLYLPESGIVARRFDGVDDYLQASPGACSIAGAFTIAALIRPQVSGVLNGVFSNNDGSASNPGLIIQATGALQLRCAGTFRNSLADARVAPGDGWVIVAVCKPAGSAAARFHVYKGSAWYRESTTAIGDPTAQANISFDGWVVGSRVFNGSDMAVVGEWNVALSDAQIDELAVNQQTQDWIANSGGVPVGLWDFSQADTGTNLTDLTGNGADQSSIVGTTAITDGPPNWVYGVTIGAANVPLEAASATSTATLALTADTTVVLETASGVSSATVALTAPTKVVLETAGAVSSATLTLTAPAKLSLSASGVSSATLFVTAQTKVVLDPASGVCSATLVVAAPGIAFLTLETASGVSSATLALTAQTKVVLSSSDSVSSATLAVTAAGKLTLSAASGVSSATLFLTAAGTVVLGAGSGIASATLALSAPTKVVLASASALSSATAALTAQTYITLAPASAVASATAGVYVPSSTVPLETANAVASATLTLTAAAKLSLSASGVSSATLLVTAQTRVVLAASSGIASATCVVYIPVVAAVIPLQTASALSSSSVLVLRAPTGVPLQSVLAVASAVLSVSARTTVVLQASSGQSSAIGVVGIPISRWGIGDEDRWDEDDENRWGTDTEERMAGVGVGDRWNVDNEERW